MSTPREVTMLGHALVLAAPAAAPVLLLDVAFAALTAGDSSIEVGLGTVASQLFVVGIFAALFAVVRRFLVRSRGRGTGMLLVGGGVLCVAYLAYLALLGAAAPVCDFGNGDACAYGTAYAPLPYAVVRVTTTLGAATVPVLVLALLARSATYRWVTRAPQLLSPPLSTRPFTVPLTTCAAAIAVLAVLHFPAAAVRLAGIRTDSELSLTETVTKAYVHAGVLAALAVAVAGVSGAVALLAWRGTSRPGLLRTLGGATVTAQVLWLFVAVSKDPVRLARFGMYDSPVPVWFHVAQGAVALTVLLTAIASLTALVLARRSD